MQELGTLCFTCAPLTFNVLPVKEHPLRNYLLSETSKASILKLFGMRKKKTLNSFTLGLHTVALSCQFMSVTFSSRFASCSYLPGKHCLISPSIATRSHVEPEQLLAKDMNICTFVQMQDTFSPMKPLRLSGLVTHSQTKSFFWGFTLDVEDAYPKLVRAVPVADVDIEGSVKPSCNFR